MFNNDTVEVSVTYRSKITFFLRLIGIAEEQQLRQKTFGLSDAEKAEKEYQANVDLLQSLSVKAPEGIEPIEGVTAPEAIIRDFFHERTALKERIAYYAVRGYFVRLAPSDFF